MSIITNPLKRRQQERNSLAPARFDGPNLWYWVHAGFGIGCGLMVLTALVGPILLLLALLVKTFVY